MSQIPRNSRADVRVALSQALLREAKYRSRYYRSAQVARCAGCALGEALGIAPPFALYGTSNIINLVAFMSATLLSIIFAGAITLLCAVTRIGWRRRRPNLAKPVPISRRIRELIIFAVPSLAMFTSSIVIFFMVFSLRHWQVSAEGAVFGLCLGLLAFLVTFRVRFLIHVVLSRSEPLNTLDPIMTRTAKLVIDMTNLAPAWRRADVSRYIIDRLGVIERSCSFLSVKDRAPLLAFRLQAEAQAPIDRLAGVIQMHKSAVVKVKSRADYDRILCSLTAGFIAMVREDWESLLANAESASNPKWYKGYLFKNIIPAAILGVFAVTLPWLPPFHSLKASTLGIRVTLGVYAVLRLIPGTSLTDLVDKGLGRGFDSAKGK